METPTDPSPVEKWALVELVGYQQFAGKVSDETISGKQYIRVEVPATKIHKAFDCKFSIESIHHITTLTQEKAEIIIFGHEMKRFGFDISRLVALGF